mmetsp:Transcript_25994/g.43486  ORF Transcript_25994/g.43486 Transcript_25994/m.43486 type:complete len:217 (+) Transcript_25994:520-1170(+)
MRRLRCGQSVFLSSEMPRLSPVVSKIQYGADTQISTLSAVALTSKQTFNFRFRSSSSVTWPAHRPSAPSPPSWRRRKCSKGGRFMALEGFLPIEGTSIRMEHCSDGSILNNDTSAPGSTSTRCLDGTVLWPHCRPKASGRRFFTTTAGRNLTVETMPPMMLLLMLPPLLLSIFELKYIVEGSCFALGLHARRKFFLEMKGSRRLTVFVEDMKDSGC